MCISTSLYTEGDFFAREEIKESNKEYGEKVFAKNGLFPYKIFTRILFKLLSLYNK